MSNSTMIPPAKPVYCPAHARVSTTQRRGFGELIKAAGTRLVHRPTSALWQLVRFGIAGVYFWIGGSYLFGSSYVAVNSTFHLLQNIEPGGMRTHGAILFALAFLLATKSAFRGQMIFALFMTLFYSLLTAALVVGGWALHEPDLAAPAWYVLIAVLSFSLIVSAPLTVLRPERRGGGTRA